MEKVNCRTCLYFCKMETFSEYDGEIMITDCCTHYDNRVIVPSYVGMKFNGEFKKHPSVLNADNECENHARLNDKYIKKYLSLFNI